MNSYIRHGITKVKDATQNIENIQDLKKSVNILLSDDINSKIDFLKKADFNDGLSVRTIASLLLFEDDKKLKIEFGKNAKKLEIAFKEHDINPDTRRQIGVILEDYVKIQLKHQKELDKQAKQEQNNNNQVSR